MHVIIIVIVSCLLLIAMHSHKTTVDVIITISGGNTTVHAAYGRGRLTVTLYPVSTGPQCDWVVTLKYCSTDKQSFLMYLYIFS